MKPLQAELDLARSTVSAALQVLADLHPNAIGFSYEATLPKEMKAESDHILEDFILDSLYTTGLDILSEEKGNIISGNPDELRWVLDPLDGTVNFIRGLAPCSISLALCRGDVPVLGVIGEFPSGKLAWGGISVDSCYSDQPIRVSTVAEKQQAVICTGFPSRFVFDDNGKHWMTKTLAPFGKVRMFGAASLSLLNVARGTAEVYAENDIMIWDVAAGLAILEGAGGAYTITQAQHPEALNIFASNALIMDC
jgi:myo-inositol-1(or 4)-monophosphatase